jgi:protein-serine/threonine kinase
MGINSNSFFSLSVNIEMNDRNRPSEVSRQRSTALKYKLVNFYRQQIREEQNRGFRLQALNSFLSKAAISPHDTFERQQQRQLIKLGKQENEYLRSKRQILSTADFLILKTIGTGAYGKVKLVQKKDTGKIHAMKTMRKSKMISKNQLGHVKSERLKDLT